MNSIKKLLIISGILGLLFFIYKSGFISLLDLKHISQLRDYVLSFGIYSVLAYILLYILVVMLGLPATAMTILGGIIFGPIFGTIYTVVGASLGLALAFLSARSLLRDIIKKKFGNSPLFTKLEEGIQEHGYRMLIITRLVPVFPFSLQNFLYGLTNINFFLYWILSTIFIIPGTAVYTLSSGAVLAGTFDSKNLIYLGIAACCFVFVTLIPKIFRKI